MQAEAEHKPQNIVYIVLDDVGFSDLGCFGSEIKTSNIDKLAASGLRYRNFHVNPNCSPSRAALLTGRDNNAVGMGAVAGIDFGEDYPYTRSRINPKAATIAEILREESFSTLGVGKWHLIPSHQITPAGPFENWPLSKGFERYYGYLNGQTDQYKPELVYDNHMVHPPSRFDYHLSEDLVDHAIQFVTDSVSINPEKPIFLYLAFGSNHTPHQVPKKYIEMYNGVYEKGWDKVRSERFERQRQMGIVPEDAVLPPSDPSIKPWDALTEEQKRLFVRFQETYAGFLTHTDEQIGRFIEFLQFIEKLDDTMVVLISDNGASSGGGLEGSKNFVKYISGIPESIAELLSEIDEIGGPRFGANYPKGWAQVSNTPFPGYKLGLTAGGIQVPLIIQWPRGIQDQGEIRSQYVDVSDITATVLDLLHLNAPNYFKGVQQLPIHGVSVKHTFNQANADSNRITRFFHTGGHRAIYHNGWKAMSVRVPGQPFEQEKWKLYQVSIDFTESNNLAEQYPEKLTELQELWRLEARKYGVTRLREVTFKDFTELPEDAANARNHFTFYPGTGYISSKAAPSIVNKSYTITVALNRSNSSEEGVLVCHGDFYSGYTLYIKGNHVVYEYNYFGDVHKIESDMETPVGPLTVRFEFRKDIKGTGGTGILFFNEREVGRKEIEKTMPIWISYEGLDVGRDSLLPVSESYADQGDYPFEGTISKVVFDIQ